MYNVYTRRTLCTICTLLDSKMGACTFCTLCTLFESKQYSVQCVHAPVTDPYSVQIAI